MSSEFSMRGRILAFSMYLIEGIILCISVFNNKRISIELAIACFAIWIVSLAIVAVWAQEKNVNMIFFYIVINILSNVIGYALVYCYQNISFILIVFMIQWIVSIYYLSRRTCLVIMLIQIMTLALLTFQTGLGVNDFLPIKMFLFYILAVALCTFISYNLISVIVWQNKVTNNQERSLDDMLRLVEVMCDEARNATKSKSDFLTNMSHEIRTPINSVLGMNEMILRESTDAKILEYARDIERSGNLLLALINDVLDFSKIESGKMEIIPVNYELSNVIDDLVIMTRSRFKNKTEVNLVTEISPDIPEYLYGDEVRIKQIITNLLTNAFKYTKKGTVTLRMKCTGREGKYMNLLIAVEDTGIGIREEDLNRLFKGFQRIDEKKNRNIEGTGLGLAITSNFVKMMNGKVEVESKYGKGSTFTVTIPQIITNDVPIGDYQKRRNENQERVGARKGTFTAEAANILIVDDNAMNLKVASLLLKRLKIATTTADGGQKAIGLIENNKYDLILLDHMMPDMDGIETLGVIRSRKIAEGIPVIALTANAVSGARDLYIDNGFSDYISKPIKADELEDILLKWLPKEKIKESNE